ncbi:hypothetical protein [Clostridium oryzae]|uniref:Uncharacterized protein n=1 Tax=Clostridium oryzae TaxID=1450648 RepID=A0A1V4IWE3_9CLOT|nr:hypothetical protein [Clostridium oryzae]OPJ64372.1 hypothetical protein CLORY_05660 [Clostridium oryzae]
MKEKNICRVGLIGNESIIRDTVDLSALGISFSSKPLVIGGLAMEYYGIRNKGKDIDFIISNDDYVTLARKYPENRKDKWGDLFISFDNCELLRSIFRFDYDFFSEGAIEYEKCKGISIEKLFFMKVLAFDNQPEVEKHTRDYKLMWDYFLKTFQNREYVANAMKHQDEYINAPDGTIYNGNYHLK